MLRRLLNRIAPPIEVDWTRAAVREQLPLLRISSPAADKILRKADVELQNADAVVYSIRIDHYTPPVLAALVISNAIIDLLQSGRYHIYRGVLRPDGEMLFGAWHVCCATLIAARKLTKETFNENQKNLEDEIAALG